jgi:DNA-3-methyladenine glycosylase II
MFWLLIYLILQGKKFNQSKVMKKILEHFQKNDPRLYSYFVKVGKIAPIKKASPGEYFRRLCKEIICQQLSDKAGDVISSRFEQLFSNNLIQPKNVLALTHEKIRAVGLSNAKASYVRNLAEAVVCGDLPITLFDSMSDKEVFDRLTKIKGIGPWTAEMFLMSSLGREDVFSFGDLGLKKALKKIYGFKNEPTKKETEELISRWSPYKTYAALVLWASLGLEE